MSYVSNNNMSYFGLDGIQPYKDEISLLWGKMRSCFKLFRDLYSTL